MAVALRAARAAPHRDHLRRSRRPPRRRRGALGGDHPRRCKQACPEMTLEVLTGDFKGEPRDVDTVLAARPDVFAHNLETVPRLSRQVRVQARYDRSYRGARARAPARARSSRPASCSASARSSTRCASVLRELAGARRPHRDPRAVPAPVEESPAGGALRDADGVRRSSRTRRSASASRTSSRGRWCAARTTPTGRPIW